MKTPVKNIFAEVPENLPDEFVESLLLRAGFKLERIVSKGHASPPGFWYDQDNDEWVMLVSGNAEILFEGEDEPRTMSSGDWVLIPAHRRHRVLWTDPENDTVWLALHFDNKGGGK
ncbi:MAG: cupin domain-containing protein [Deltaproteobacteria bacterium]|nr:cupin domain-containing protein [Deltaproteobacteria bacterium]